MTSLLEKKTIKKFLIKNIQFFNYVILYLGTKKSKCEKRTSLKIESNKKYPEKGKLFEKKGRKVTGLSIHL